ncbi:MAG: carbohydrate ABC transporter permease [Acidimicrobiales bacterium]
MVTAAGRLRTTPGRALRGLLSGPERDDDEGTDYLVSLPRRVVTLWIPLAIFIVVLLFPFYWMFMTALKPNANLYNYKKFMPLWVSHPTLTNFDHLLFHTDFLAWLGTSFLASIMATAISLVISVLAAYGIQRVRFRGSGLVGNLVFLAYLVPPAILFIPLAQVVFNLHLYNSRWSLVVIYPTILIPFCTWLLMGYFRTIPFELEEVALMDGASRLQIIRKVILPLAGPGLISAGIFSFTLSWNDFLYALTFINSTPRETVPVGAWSNLVNGDVYQWGPLMAAAIIGSVPVVLVYSLFARHYVAGMTGAVKE